MWTDTHWLFDETLKAFDLSRDICRTAAGECNEQKLCSTIASAKTVAAVERSPKPIGASRPRSINGIPIRGSLTLPVVSLICAMVNAGRRIPPINPLKSRRRRGTVATYSALARVSASRDRRRRRTHRLSARVAGYCLTGITREHALFFLTAPAPTVRARSSMPSPVPSVTIVVSRHRNLHRRIRRATPD